MKSVLGGHIVCATVCWCGRCFAPTIANPHKTGVLILASSQVSLTDLGQEGDPGPVRPSVLSWILDASVPSLTIWLQESGWHGSWKVRIRGQSFLSWDPDKATGMARHLERVKETEDS